ncbi:MAG: zinc ribbon domain-containing protein [Candidatus Omnitrophica bacterium]|nr:zinc ribbon domain-containing protein [Candidatus Omnitrophota bacterium]
MPTYEYECSACGHAFEALQTMTEDKLSKCPKCKKNKLARLIGSGSGVIFKGTGFYETDYKKKSESKPSSKDAPCASGSCPMKSSGGCGAK